MGFIELFGIFSFFVLILLFFHYRYEELHVKERRDYVDRLFAKEYPNEFREYAAGVETAHADHVVINKNPNVHPASGLPMHDELPNHLEEL